MKNNILAIIVAAGTAVVGSSLFSVPARALTVNQDVGVEINVPEVLYLRTFQTLSLDITEDELAGGTGVVTAGVGKDFDPTSPTSDGTTALDPTSPFAGVTTPISRTVNQLYAVWSNNPNGFAVTLTNPTATLTSAGGATATMSNLQKTVGTDPTSAVGLITPHIGGASFDLDLTTATEAATYTGGVINVNVVSP